MTDPRLAVRPTAEKGLGVFALAPFAAGELVVVCEGERLATSALPDHGLALQLGADLWLWSAGGALDDRLNHSCEPNLAFAEGEPRLHALRAIAPGEELTWDYSTSIGDSEWSLACRCGRPGCRGVVTGFGRLAPADRERLAPFALRWLIEEERGASVLGRTGSRSWKASITTSSS
jgi:SET domain-containing protein